MLKHKQVIDRPTEIKLTAAQGAFLWWLLQSTKEVTDTKVYVRMSLQIQLKLEASNDKTRK